MKRLLFLCLAICAVLLLVPPVSSACGLSGASSLQLNQAAYCVPQQQQQLLMAPQYVMPQLDLPTCPTLGLSAQSSVFSQGYGSQQLLQAPAVNYGTGLQLQLGQQLGYGAGLGLQLNTGGYSQNGLLLDTGAGFAVDPVTGLVIDNGGRRQGLGGRGRGLHRGGRGRGRGVAAGRSRATSRSRGTGSRSRSRTRTRTRTRSR